MFTRTRFGLTLFRTSSIALLLALVAVLALGSARAPIASGQDQGVRESPPYDPAQVTVPSTPPFAAGGRSSYAENCAPCHGEQGLGDGPTAADLPGPPTAFADPAAIAELSPAMLFHTTKFGRLQAMMPPWQNQLDDGEIWDTVAYAWSLHTTEAATTAGQALYAESCANCHGDGGAGDGPEATAGINDFTNLEYTTFRSQADWLAGWQDAHAEIGADWTKEQKDTTLEYIRTFSYIPPWVSPYRPGSGVITGTIVFGGEGAPTTIQDGLVYLDAYLGFDPVATFTGTVNADNTFVFENLGISPDIAYLATVVADGISYSSQLVGLTAEQPAAEAAVNIYGVTDSPADIRVNRLHWILDSQPGALVVAQIYLLGNTGDQTFVGQTVEGVDVPVTAAIPVPADAQELTLENGSVGDRFRRVGDMLYDTMPIVPGDSTQQVIVQYALPYNGTSYDMKQGFEYPIDSLSLLVNNLPNLRVDVPAMEFDSIQNLQGAEYQVWRQTDLTPGQVEVKMQGLLERGGVDPRAVGATTDTGTSGMATVAPPMESWVAWAMAAIVAAIVLALVGFALQRGTLSTVTTRQDLQSMRDSLLTQIARIDDLHTLGQMGDTEWLRRRADLKAQLVDVMRRLESTRPAHK